MKKNAEAIKLITASISFNQDGAYWVAFTTHHPELRSLEFVRLILHFYAKILYIFSPPNVLPSLMLKTFVDKNLATGINKNSDVLRTANVSDVAKLSPYEPHNANKRIVVTFYFLDIFRRHIATEIPPGIYEQDIVYSVLVLLQAIIPRLDDFDIGILNQSLQNMKSAYDSGKSFSEMTNLTVIPTEAFHSIVGLDGMTGSYLTAKRMIEERNNSQGSEIQKRETLEKRRAEEANERKDLEERMRQRRNARKQREH